eukprot:GHVP01055877.1.p1 GENE.GHVP01055877.1~~GHVP01055877.1.p1  ORF type:complete len:862 (+),score=173.36 GHVP01055877.1:145-2730(+)
MDQPQSPESEDKASYKYTKQELLDLCRKYECIPDAPNHQQVFSLIPLKPEGFRNPKEQYRLEDMVSSGRKAHPTEVRGRGTIAGRGRGRGRGLVDVNPPIKKPTEEERIETKETGETDTPHSASTQNAPNDGGFWSAPIVKPIIKTLGHQTSLGTRSFESASTVTLERMLSIPEPPAEEPPVTQNLPPPPPPIPSMQRSMSRGLDHQGSKQSPFSQQGSESFQRAKSGESPEKDPFHEKAYSEDFLHQKSSSASLESRQYTTSESSRPNAPLLPSRLQFPQPPPPVTSRPAPIPTRVHAPAHTPQHTPGRSGPTVHEASSAKETASFKGAHPASNVASYIEDANSPASDNASSLGKEPPSIPKPAPAKSSASSPSSSQSPTSPSMPLGWQIDPLQVIWQYQDKHEATQGPFHSKRMRDWYDEGHLPDNLPLRYAPGFAFIPMNKLFKGLEPFSCLPSVHPVTGELTTPKLPDKSTAFKHPAPKPAAPKPAAPKPAAPKTAAPKTAAPKPAAPKTAASASSALPTPRNSSSDTPVAVEPHVADPAILALHPPVQAGNLPSQVSYRNKLQFPPPMFPHGTGTPKGVNTFADFSPVSRNAQWTTDLKTLLGVGSSQKSLKDESSSSSETSSIKRPTGDTEAKDLQDSEESPYGVWTKRLTKNEGGDSSRFVDIMQQQESQKLTLPLQKQKSGEIRPPPIKKWVTRPSDASGASPVELESEFPVLSSNVGSESKKSASRFKDDSKAVWNPKKKSYPREPEALEDLQKSFNISLEKQVISFLDTLESPPEVASYLDLLQIGIADVHSFARQFCQLPRVEETSLAKNVETANAKHFPDEDLHQSHLNNKREPEKPKKGKLKAKINLS